MLAAERIAIISERLATHRRVLADELAAEFGVSEDTIRRDLRELAAQGRCQRVYGGALATTQTPQTVQERRGEFTDRKQLLAGAAVKLLLPGQFAMLDSGSTNLAVAQNIPRGLRLTIATHDMAIAATLANRDDIELIVLGGRIDPRTGSATSGQTLAAARKLHPDVLFLGVCAIDADVGITSFQFEDAELKTALVENANTVIAIALSEKLSTAAAFHVAKADCISQLVTEKTVPQKQLAAFNAAGIAIMKV